MSIQAGPLFHRLTRSAEFIHKHTLTFPILPLQTLTFLWPCSWCTSTKPIAVLTWGETPSIQWWRAKPVAELEKKVQHPPPLTHTISNSLWVWSPLLCTYLALCLMCPVNWTGGGGLAAKLTSVATAAAASLVGVSDHRAVDGPNVKDCRPRTRTTVPNRWRRVNPLFWSAASAAVSFFPRHFLVLASRALRCGDTHCL